MSKRNKKTLVWSQELLKHLIPALCQPYVNLLLGDFDDSHRETILIRKLIKSTETWAASIITARLPAIRPPELRKPRSLLDPRLLLYWGGGWGK